MDGYIHHITPTTDANQAYLIVDSGVLKYTHDEGITPTEIILPELCDHTEVVRIGMRNVLVILGSRNRLFLDGAEVANNITSICVHSEFLLLTTLQHALVTVRMDELGFSKFSTSTLSIKSWGTDIDESTGNLTIITCLLCRFILGVSDFRNKCQMPFLCIGKLF